MKLLMLLLTCSSLTWASDHSVKGFVDSYHGFGLERSGLMLSSRTRIRLETLFSGKETQAFASINGVHNEVVTQESGVNLREAYIQYSGEMFDVRVGKQIIIWGKADGFQITDLISPQDYSEFMARDFDDMRMPISAIKARFSGDNIGLEWIWIPAFTPTIYPYIKDGVVGAHDDNPWAVVMPRGHAVNDAQDPDITLQNSEIAFKFSLNSSILDFAIMGHYGWDDLPAMHQSGTTIDLKYHRMGMVGLEYSLPFSSFVFRGESAYTTGRYRLLKLGGVQKSDLLSSIIGVDWYPGSNWTLGVQLYNQHIVDYRSAFQEKENLYYSSINISKKLMRDELTLALIFFYGLSEGDSYGRFSVDYTLSDGFHLITGLDLFMGDSGRFGRYENNDQIFMKVKYSF